MATSSMSPTAMSSMTTLRLSGLASGMDTESMVTTLMKAERMRYDKLTQQKTLMDWKKDANLEINNLLRTFRDSYFSALSPDNVLSTSSILMNKVTMDASSSISITAGTDALAGSHRIDSITSLATGANAASAAAVSAGGISVDAALSSLALTTPLSFEDGEISFSINNQTFTFKPTDTLRTVINAVNANSDANVQMSYSSLTGKLSIANKKLGSDSSLVIDNLKGNAFLSGGAAFGIEEGTVANGSDAVLSIDGVVVTQKSNSFTIDGVNYTLKDTAAAPQKFTVEQDIDGAVNKIKKFVDAYNTLIEKLDGKISEKKNRDYTPLTDDQRTQMSDTQVQQWETIAKTGLLQNDSYISGLLRDMRGAFYDKVTAAGASASSIGLSTIGYQSKGAIQVDETKLRQALKNNPQQVADIFTDMSRSTDPAKKYADSGLAARIQTSVNNYINDYQGYRTDSFNTQYKTLTDNMDRMEQQLQDKEDRYWRQFTAMEQALANMNSQSQWLSQQFSSGSNG